MTEFTLTETAALGQIKVAANGASLSEETGFAIASVTIRTGKETGFRRAFKSRYGIAAPDACSNVVAGKETILGAALDQVFVLTAGDPGKLTSSLIADFDATATITDQSDGWVRLDLTGPRAGEALERLSMVDTSDAGFPVGSAARTVMEHIGVIICRVKPKPKEDTRFIILTPRSSAEGILHALLESPPFTE